ncbi:MAG: rhomboid family intramembrane serine protease [Acidobacteriota bacterium]
MRRTMPSSVTYSFGPGPLTPAVKGLIVVNVAVFLLSWVVPEMIPRLGLYPAGVFGNGWLWQPFTYMFLHGDLLHLLFNMLALWMFGVELERLWGTTFFSRYYLVCGAGAAATTILVSLLPFRFADALYVSLTIGASGAVYGLLLAYAIYYPARPIYLYFLFPVPARVFVIIIGAITLYSSIRATGSGIAHATHLGGLVAGYLYLKGRRGGLLALVRYRIDRWRYERRRRHLQVRHGGRSGGPDRWVH